MDKICNLWSIKQNGFQANLLVKAGGSVMHISQIKKDGPLVFSSILSSCQGCIDFTVTQ